MGQKKEEQYSRHQIKAKYESFRHGGMKDRKTAGELQHEINWYLGEENEEIPPQIRKDFFPYEKHEYMKEDSTWGNKSKFRFQRFLELDEAISQDSVFQEVIEGQKKFYRKFPFTTEKDTAHWEKYRK